MVVLRYRFRIWEYYYQAGRQSQVKRYFAAAFGGSQGKGSCESKQLSCRLACTLCPIVCQHLESTVVAAQDASVYLVCCHAVAVEQTKI